ncbi:MAG: hypothetical protein PSV35_08565, partial [bacterium]|nr:hypothetical protein [bacterium]
MRHINRANTLKALLTQPLADEQLITDYLEHPLLTPSIVEALLPKSSKNLLLTLTKKTVQQCKSPKTATQAEWQNCLLTLSKQAAKNGIAQELNDLMSADVFSEPAFCLQILSILGVSILDKLPLAKLLAIANKEELKIILSVNIFPSLTLDQQIALIVNCSDDLVDVIFSTQTVEESLLTAMLILPKLTSHHLTGIVNKAFSEENLTRAFKHPKANDITRSNIYQHPLFSKNILITLLKEQLVAEEELSDLLKHSSHMHSEVLLTIAQMKLSDRRIIVALLLHKNITDEVVTALLNNQPVLPVFMLLVLNRPSFSISENLAQVLVIKAQEEYLKDSIPWESTLLDILKKAVVISTKGHIASLLQLNQATDPQFALKILVIFGEEIINKLPLERMVSIASGNDLKNILNISISDQKILFLLIQRCSLDEQVTTLLKQELNDTNLEYLLNHVPLSENHLIQILQQKMINKTCIKLIYHHKNSNEKIHFLTTKHALFSAEIPTADLNIQRLNEDELLHLLTTDLFIYAEQSSVERICSEIITLPQCSSQVIKKVIEQHCSAHLLATILNQSEKYIDLDLLIHMAKKALFAQETSDLAYAQMLLLIFKRAQALGKSDGMIFFLNTYKENISPAVAYNALLVFRSAVKDIISIKDLVTKATPEMLTLILDNNSTG